MFVRL